MNKLLAFLNVFGLVAVLIMNLVATSGAISPQTMAEVGESRAVFFLPAGYVFAIWGVIYLGLIAFAIYQARQPEVRTKISWYFILSCAANAIWLVLFLYDLVWESTIAMLVLLFSLLMMYRRLGVGSKVSQQENWFVHIPFSIYLGWISVATVANFSAALHDSGFVTAWLGIGADIWAVVMMLVAAVLAYIFIFNQRNYAYALVIVWALVGIYVRPFDTATFAPLAELNRGLVDTAALSLAVLVAIGILVKIGLSFNQNRKELTPSRVA